jgi:pyruvate, water dikinase
LVKLRFTCTVFVGSQCAKRNGRHCGICGQAPSDYPEMAEFLVEVGIDSISLIPDTVIKTTVRVLEVEKRLGYSPWPD